MSFHGETSGCIAKCQLFSQSTSEHTFTCMIYTPQLMASLGVGCPFNPSTMPWLSFQLLLSTEIVSKDCNNFMIKFNMNLWKTYYLNFGVKNYMKVDHRSYRRNFCNCKKKDWKKFRLVQDSNPWPLWYRCSALTNWATSKLGADRYMWTVGWIRIIWK